MDKSLIEKAIIRLNELMHEKGIHASFVVCGGGALILQGCISRDTNDLDVVSPPVDEAIRTLVVQVAGELRLSDLWLNSHADSLTRELPGDWQSLIEPLYSGSNLEIFGISRRDMILSKFWAYCDRDDDMDDLLKLHPTRDELDAAIRWTTTKDGNPDWPRHVQLKASSLKRGLGYE